jgi:hypothetical protein
MLVSSFLSRGPFIWMSEGFLRGALMILGGFKEGRLLYLTYGSNSGSVLGIWWVLDLMPAM